MRRPTSLTEPAEPMAHLPRPSLPWREGQPLAECGLRTEGLPLITRAEVLARVRRGGRQQAFRSVCATCWETANRWSDWEHDPLDAMAREVSPVGGRRTPLILEELLALAELARAHPEEFQALVDDLHVTRRAKAAQAARRTRRAVAPRGRTPR